MCVGSRWTDPAPEEGVRPLPAWSLRSVRRTLEASPACACARALAHQVDRLTLAPRIRAGQAVDNSCPSRPQISGCC